MLEQPFPENIRHRSALLASARRSASPVARPSVALSPVTAYDAIVYPGPRDARLRPPFGESLKMAGAILGHSTVAATEIYAHLQHDPSKIAADRVTGAISAALDGNSSAEIVPLRRA